MKRKKPKTYETTIGGRKTRLTVPENPKPEEALADALRENLSPEAVAAVACCLTINRTNDQEVDRQVRWFHEKLVEVLGGYDEYNRLIEELGL